MLLAFIDFCLFLFPIGTGKTRTLVAAILEIIRSSENYILVCCNSNSACDEITERLVDRLNKDEIFRIFAKSINKSSISPKIQPICNLINDEIKFPSFAFINKFRVVILTLQTAGSYVRGRELDKDFNSGHFSYLFIDEAASVSEPLSFIPIGRLCSWYVSLKNISLRRHHCPCQLFNEFGKKKLFIDFLIGLCSEIGAVKSSIILAGDVRQLDAVTKSNHAASFGFKTSFMEHLSNKPCYEKKYDGHYNPNLIVQLVQNYRSHPDILCIPNKLFYHNELVCKASEGW